MYRAIWACCSWALLGQVSNNHTFSCMVALADIASNSLLPLLLSYCFLRLDWLQNVHSVIDFLGVVPHCLYFMQPWNTILSPYSCSSLILLNLLLSFSLLFSWFRFTCSFVHHLHPASSLFRSSIGLLCYMHISNPSRRCSMKSRQRNSSSPSKREILSLPFSDRRYAP